MRQDAIGKGAKTPRLRFAFQLCRTPDLKRRPERRNIDR
jgi:hypothetical protein